MVKHFPVFQFGITSLSVHNKTANWTLLCIWFFADSPVWTGFTKVLGNYTHSNIPFLLTLLCHWIVKLKKYFLSHSLYKFRMLFYSFRKTFSWDLVTAIKPLNIMCIVSTRILARNILHLGTCMAHSFIPLPNYHLFRKAISDSPTPTTKLAPLVNPVLHYFWY